MEHLPSKRPSNFTDTSFLPKRPKIADAYPSSPQSPTFSDTTEFGGGGRRASGDDSRQHVLPSAEVAQDFKDSLQDLTMNDRSHISNLTVIAKESTEHAAAISRALETHIRIIAPPRKLPALYVLDSIVKNVGTPYTIFLGQNLYKTFMDAYTLVDGQTRKNMESMLKTWKEPIPGSMENRPVFAVDITRPIENALIKARTAFVQQQQQQARSQKQYHTLPPRPPVPAQQAWRNTPTPPQTDQRYAPPQHEQVRYGTPQYEQPRYGTPSTDFQYGNALPSHNLAPQQSKAQPPAYATNQYLQHHQAHPTPPPPPLPPTPQIPNLSSLAALLQATGNFPGVPQQSTPQPQPQHQQQQQPAPHISTPQPPVPSFPGLEALFQSQQGWTAPAQAKIATPPPTRSAISTPPVAPAVLHRSTLSEVNNNVKLTTAILKVPRPELLSSLYDMQPSQCTTCGRRFAGTEAGRARKGRHLDWHFRTNMRIGEASKAGITRSWYVDEMEWIKYREPDEADPAPVAAKGTTAENGVEDSGATGAGQNIDSKRTERYVKAPADAAAAHHACPICQEEFQTVWHDGAQEWVWMDAVKHGEKTFHASCLDELTAQRTTK